MNAQHSETNQHREQQKRWDPGFDSRRWTQCNRIFAKCSDDLNSAKSAGSASLPGPQIGSEADQGQKWRVGTCLSAVYKRPLLMCGWALATFVWIMSQKTMSGVRIPGREDIKFKTHCWSERIHRLEVKSEAGLYCPEISRDRIMVGHHTGKDPMVVYQVTVWRWYGNKLAQEPQCLA